MGEFLEDLTVSGLVIVLFIIAAGGLSFLWQVIKAVTKKHDDKY